MDIDKLSRRLERKNKPVSNGRVKVYSLIDTVTKDPVYIGQTRNTLEERLKWHRFNYLSATEPSLINKYLVSNDVEIKLLKDYAVWNFNEVQLIKEYLTKGYPLLNMTLGGTTTRYDLEQFMLSLHKG